MASRGRGLRMNDGECNAALMARFDLVESGKGEAAY
jgi:hypothetical protein